MSRLRLKISKEEISAQSVDFSAEPDERIASRSEVESPEPLTMIQNRSPHLDLCELDEDALVCGVPSLVTYRRSN